MSFKILFFLFLITSCGVKGNPVPPAGTIPPSYMDNYPDLKLEQSSKEAKNQ